MIHVRRLMESLPMTERIPFKELITNDYIPEPDFIVATKGENSAFVYIPTGWPAKLDLKKLDWKNSVVWWYNPRTGEAKNSGEIPNVGIREFKPETDGRGNYWVLVLDNKDASFTPLGQ